MIADEKELEYTTQCLGRMYTQRSNAASQPHYSPDLSATMVESVSGMIRKLEREVAEYLAKKYNLVPTSCAAQSEMREDIAA